MREYNNEPELLREINMCLGKDNNLDKMIQRKKQKQLGNKPTNIDDFDPRTYLESTNNSDILVIDSNEELPHNWKEDINKPDKQNTERDWNNISN